MSSESLQEESRETGRSSKFHEISMAGQRSHFAGNQGIAFPLRETFERFTVFERARGLLLLISSRPREYVDPGLEEPSLHASSATISVTVDGCPNPIICTIPGERISLVLS